ncbi:MAG: hypothetical protein LCI03_15950 [Actinobacteria bacterium]|nr:hypothetical protein [Actinomycetota bacterium]
MAIGMRASGAQVELVFRAAIWTAQDQEDAEDIVSELEALLGPEVSVHQKIEAPVSARVLASPGLRWIFAARSDTR